MNKKSNSQGFTDSEQLTESVARRDDVLYQAQAILAVRDHSEYEMRTKLVRKGFPSDEVDEAVAWLKKLRLLDDEKFAALVVTETLRFKPVGPRWLINKLQQKGIAHEFIEPAVYGIIDDAKEAELASAAADGWRRSHPRYATDQQRVIRFLVSRGFSYEAAASAAQGA